MEAMHVQQSGIVCAVARDERKRQVPSTPFDHAVAMRMACKRLAKREDGGRRTDTADAENVVQEAFIIWHKSRVGGGTCYDTASCVRFAMRRHFQQRKRNGRNDLSYAQYLNGRIKANGSVRGMAGDIPCMRWNDDDGSEYSGDETDIVILKWRASGSKIDHIAEHLGMSQQAISKRLAKLGERCADYTIADCNERQESDRVYGDASKQPKETGTLTPTSAMPAFVPAFGEAAYPGYWHLSTWFISGDGI